MLPRAFSFAYAVCSVGVGHELELLVVFDEFIEQGLCIAVVYVVIACAMDDQQVSFYVFDCGGSG